VKHAQLLVQSQKYPQAAELLKKAQKVKPRDNVQRYLEKWNNSHAWAAPEQSFGNFPNALLMEIQHACSQIAPQSESGAEVTAVQTLCECLAFTNRAERLDCGAFTAAFLRGSSPFHRFSFSPLRLILAMVLTISFAILTAQAQDSGAVSGVV
jgi:hypothetical protein